MATQDRTVSYIVGQLSGLGGVSARKMFGEYGLSYEGKPVGVICNDQLSLKVTAIGRTMTNGAPEIPPYRGAKPSLLIDPERWDDSEWLSALVRATADALPEPKPRKR